MEQVASTWITTCWESYRLARDAMTEAMFLGTYGSPLLQAVVGHGNARRRRRSAASSATWRARRSRRARRPTSRSASRWAASPEAVIRAIMHVRLPERTVDERGFAVLQAIRRLQPANRRRSLGEIKTMFRDQYLLLRLDEERAVRAIPRLLPDDDGAPGRGLEGRDRRPRRQRRAARRRTPPSGAAAGAVRRPWPPIDEGDGTCLTSPPPRRGTRSTSG